MKNDLRKRIIILLGFCVISSLVFYEGIVNSMNTTTYAFSYQYGFKARAFMGTILRIFNKIFPYDFMSYRGVVVFSIMLDILFIAILFVFYIIIFKNADKKQWNKLYYLMIMFSIFAFPEFLTEENLGRTDVCLVIISILGLILLLKDKWEFLIIPLSAIAVCIHQGYVLMYFNVFLVILFCRIIERQGKEKTKSIVVFALSIIVAAILFIFLNFYSHDNGYEIFDEIFSTASGLAHDGAVHRELMMHEILGENPFTDEWKYHVFNFKEMALFIIFFIPYIIIAFNFFKGCIKDVKGIDRLKYLAIALGPATLLPDFIVKIDYARWIFAGLFYYFIIIMYFVALKDEVIIKNINVSWEKLKRNKVLAIVLLAYPMLFMPLGDWKISPVTTEILRLLGQGKEVL